MAKKTVTSKYITFTQLQLDQEIEIIPALLQSKDNATRDAGGSRSAMMRYATDLLDKIFVKKELKIVKK